MKPVSVQEASASDVSKSSTIVRSATETIVMSIENISRHRQASPKKTHRRSRRKASTDPIKGAPLRPGAPLSPTPPRTSFRWQGSTPTVPRTVRRADRDGRSDAPVDDRESGEVLEVTHV